MGHRAFVYRGKREFAHNQTKWVYGYLTSYSEEIATIKDADSNKAYLVDPKSVGMCVVSQSMNFDLEPFDGDIVRVVDDYDNPNGYTQTFHNDYLCSWNDDMSAFCFYYIDPEKGLMYDDYVLINEFNNCNDFTIIGNEYDNPELLKISQEVIEDRSDKI